MYVKYYIQSGYYANEEAFTTELTNEVAEAQSTLIDFTTKFINNEHATKMILHIEDITESYRFIISGFERVLGFDGNIGYQNRLLADSL